MNQKYNPPDYPPRARRRKVPAEEVVEPLLVAGLFAGIGGIEFGLARSEHRSGLLCEIDEAALEEEGR